MATTTERIPEPLQRRALACRAKISKAFRAIERLHRALDKIDEPHPEEGGRDGREDDGR